MSSRRTGRRIRELVRAAARAFRGSSALEAAMESSKLAKNVSKSLSAGGFTVEGLCSLIGAEIPCSLLASRTDRVNGIDARPGQLRQSDVFFDAQNSLEDVRRALETECLFIVTQNHEIEEVEKPIVLVDDAFEAYVSACQKIVEDRKDLVRVAVGGSSGKTSMKDMVAFVLGEHCFTQKSFSNSNNIFGVGKQMGRLTKAHKCYVQEVGLASDGRGELTERLAEVFQPDVAILTNIGDNHKEQYGSKASIFHFKSQIAEHVRAGGLALLNKDDALLSAYKPDCQTWYYSILDQNSDVYAYNIESTEDGMAFDMQFRGETFEGVRIKVRGEHNVYNALASFATARFLGYSGNSIVEALGKFELSYQTRQNYRQIGKINHYIDCFNSSPESVKNALKTVAGIRLQDGAKRVAVLGDIAELGEESPLLHEAVGRMVGDFPIDTLICYGSLSEKTFQAACEVGVKACYAGDRDELEKLVLDAVAPGDMILWKASHSMHLELSIDNIWGTDFYTLYPEEGDGKSIVEGDYQCRMYGNGAKITKYERDSDAVEVPERFGGIPLRTIGYRAFRKKRLKQVVLPFGLVSIGRESFLSCSGLEEVQLPETVKYIGPGAFKLCSSLRRLVVPQSCLHIDEDAFSKCGRLEEVVFLGNDTHVDDQAFSECSDVSFVHKLRY